MIADHMIKINGVWYKTGDEIPEIEPHTVKDATDIIATEPPKKRGRKPKKAGE